jgi:hypothetical protein
MDPKGTAETTVKSKALGGDAITTVQADTLSCVTCVGCDVLCCFLAPIVDFGCTKPTRIVCLFLPFFSFTVRLPFKDVWSWKVQRGRCQRSTTPVSSRYLVPCEPEMLELLLTRTCQVSLLRKTAAWERQKKNRPYHQLMSSVVGQISNPGRASYARGKGRISLLVNAKDFRSWYHCQFASALYRHGHDRRTR